MMWRDGHVAWLPAMAEPKNTGTSRKSKKGLEYLIIPFTLKPWLTRKGHRGVPAMAGRTQIVPQRDAGFHWPKIFGGTGNIGLNGFGRAFGGVEKPNILGCDETQSQ